MDPKMLQKMLEVQAAAQQDAHYANLLKELEPVQDRFNAVLLSLSPAQQRNVTDYLGITLAMHLRLLEIACSR